MQNLYVRMVPTLVQRKTLSCSVQFLRGLLISIGNEMDQVPKRIHVITYIIYRSVPQICPPFCNLSLSTKRRGAYTRDATISLAITHSLSIKHDSIVIIFVGGG